MKYDIVIVGGGPAGLYTALNISKSEVLVLEEHEKVGLPKHCAGIVGLKTAQRISRISRKLLTSSYRSIKFITPRKTYTVTSKVPIAFHVDRPELESALASRVESAGHKVVTSARAKPSQALKIKALGREFAYKYLVVAEGASGLFRKVLIGDQDRCLYAIQAIVRTKDTVEDSIYILYDTKNPDFFAWIIPLDKTTLKLGFASREPHVKYLDFIEKKAGIKVAGVIERFGGIIPLYKPLKNPVVFTNVVFHGDAVPLTKPYTGGGLFSIFELSPVLARCLDLNKPVNYISFYRKMFYFRNMLERLVVAFLRKTRYYIPVEYVSVLSKLGFITPFDFDNHLNVLAKSLLILPIALPIQTLNNNVS
ncbi:MAG: NAD(P)/FAD-dependent oxidoreductase [Desulfurococcaceae archaeon]